MGSHLRAGMSAAFIPVNQEKAIMSKTTFATIHSTTLETVTGGVKRDPQVDTNGAIVGGERIVRRPQVGFNGAIVGGDRIRKVVHTPQVDVNGAIVGGQRWPQ